MPFNYENFFNTVSVGKGQPNVEKIAVEEIATPEEIAAMRRYLRSFGEEGASGSPEFFFAVYDARIMNLPVRAASICPGDKEEAILRARIALVDALMKEADREMIAEVLAQRNLRGAALEH